MGPAAGVFTGLLLWRGAFAGAAGEAVLDLFTGGKGAMPFISLTGAVAVADGPRFNLNRKLVVDAYDHISVAVPAGETDLEIQIQPATADLVSVLLITADSYDPALTYKVNDAASTTVVALDEVQLFYGHGAVSLFGDEPPRSLFFTNSTSGNEARDIVVEILAGRAVTPP